MADNTGHLTDKEILQVLIDLHEECERERRENWDVAIKSMCELSAEQFEAVRKAFTRSGEVMMIETVFAMLTSFEDANNVFGG